MNKKKLPKAVLRTAEDMQAGSHAGSRPASDNIIEMTPKSEPARTAEGASKLLDLTDEAAALRRRKAIGIVERYANGSAVGGALPIPLLNATAITALLVRMVKRLSELYD